MSAADYFSTIQFIDRWTKIMVPGSALGGTESSVCCSINEH